MAVSPTATLAGIERHDGRPQRVAAANLVLYPIFTSQYSSATFYQVSYHIQ